MKVFSFLTVFFLYHAEARKTDSQPSVPFDLLLLIPNLVFLPCGSCVGAGAEPGCTSPPSLFFLPPNLHMKCNQQPEVLLKWVMLRVTTTVIPSQPRSARLLMTMLRRISLSLAPRAHTQTHTHMHALTRTDTRTDTFLSEVTSNNIEGIHGRQHNGSEYDTPTHNRPLVLTHGGTSICAWASLGVATIHNQTGSGSGSDGKGRGHPVVAGQTRLHTEWATFAVQRDDEFILQQQVGGDPPTDGRRLAAVPLCWLWIQICSYLGSHCGSDRKWRASSKSPASINREPLHNTLSLHRKHSEEHAWLPWFFEVAFWTRRATEFSDLTLWPNDLGVKGNWLVGIIPLEVSSSGHWMMEVSAECRRRAVIGVEIDFGCFHLMSNVLLFWPLHKLM